MNGDTLRALFSSGELTVAAERYVLECYGDGAQRQRGKGARFPNLAGFCRTLGVSVELLRREGEGFPELYGVLMSIFEDEALNSAQSPTLLSAYMKERLSFGERHEDRSLLPIGDVQLIFEHDPVEDGK